MSQDDSKFPPVDPFATGLKGRCPRCAEGSLFDGFLGIQKSCYNCHLDFDFADSGDGPAVIVMTLVGFIIVGLALWIEVSYAPPFWLQLLLWIPLSIGLGLYLLRIMKGIVICIQFKNKAQQGELDRDE